MCGGGELRGGNVVLMFAVEGECIFLSERSYRIKEVGRNEENKILKGLPFDFVRVMESVFFYMWLVAIHLGESDSPILKSVFDLVFNNP